MMKYRFRQPEILFYWANLILLPKPRPHRVANRWQFRANAQRAATIIAQTMKIAATTRPQSMSLREHGVT